nr:hypothetical protein [uncultured bacterium]
MLLPLFGCRLVGARPTNFRDWSPDMDALCTAEVNRSVVTVRNIRSCDYQTEDTYVVNRYDQTFDLTRLRSVDLVVIPFKNTPSLAHTMFSFGFDDEQYLAVSIEPRRVKGATAGAFLSFLDQYELAYVVGDERDLIRLRTNVRGEDVYLYRMRTTPEQAWGLFTDVMERANQLAQRPEFYNALTNNCTTNLVDHINRVSPGTIRYGPGVLLPGYFDRVAFDAGLLDTRGSYAETRRRARINDLALRYGERPDFSKLIRR